MFLAAVLIISTQCGAQNLTGIWRGYFYSGHGIYKQYYKYEVQINQKANAGLAGVTFSYRTTIFYAKTSMTGIWFKTTKNVLLQERDLLDIKMSQNSEACPMTCDLSYSKMDTTEILEGTFTSVKSDKTDCGSGNVYLERVQQSDFKKEDFLLNQSKAIKPASPKTTPPVVLKKLPGATTSIDTKNNIKKLQSALGVTADGVAGPKTLAALQQKLPDVKTKPDYSNTKTVQNLISRLQQQKATAKQAAPKQQNVAPQPKTLPQVQKPATPKNDTIVAVPQVQKTEPVIPKKQIAVPQILKERSSSLYRTIVTNSANIHIELFDNGEVDGDTITVYHNNEIIAFKKGLSQKPIAFDIKADLNEREHKLVMVADNLGSIPPNTALMIVTTGGKRYEVFLTSDNKKNAEVIIDYAPDN